MTECCVFLTNVDVDEMIRLFESVEPKTHSAAFPSLLPCEGRWTRGGWVVILKVFCLLHRPPGVFTVHWRLVFCSTSDF